MAASWAGFGSSMLLTLCLLTGVPSRSRAVQWPFLVAYSSLVLTFITSQSRTSLAMDVLIWAAVMAVLTVGIKYRRLDRLRFLLCPPAPGPPRP
uniref:PGG domain-containing protein n=1 Tax=Oryza brachyantha TaxID=4533 RepID=J3KYD9_ORYBR